MPTGGISPTRGSAPAARLIINRVPAPRGHGPAQRQSCLSSQLKVPLSEKGTCHPVLVRGRANVNGWHWERAVTGAAAWRTFPGGSAIPYPAAQSHVASLSSLRCPVAELNHPLLCLVSISWVPLRCHGLRHKLLPLVRGNLESPKPGSQAVVWSHTLCT